MIDERKLIHAELQVLQELQRELEIKYEQYFAGIEKREPMKERDQLEKRIRKLMQKTVIQTELKFRIASLSSRFQTYNQRWARTMRLIEEGKFHRGGRKQQRPPSRPQRSESDRLYEELQTLARKSEGQIRVPSKDHFDAYIKRQQSEIHKKFGDQPVELSLKTDGNKPRLVVRRKP